MDRIEPLLRHEAPDWVTLRIFLAAIDLGSITRAADHCNIATSAAAKRMQLLEADCGLPLLERRARGVKPTAAGEIVARYARGLFDLAFRLGDDLNAFRTGGIGSVRLHVTLSAIAGNELAETLALFTVKHPNIRVEVREDISLRVLRDLVEGQADLVIITSSRRLPSDFDVHPWREDCLVAVMPVSDPLATLSSISFSAVIDRLNVSVLEHSALTLLIEDEAQRLGRSVNPRFRVNNSDSARRLIAAGHGIGILPEGVVRPYEAALGIRGVPLTDEWSQRQLLIVSPPAAMLSVPARLLLAHLLGHSPHVARTD
jgi:DNA-binding transcriptional LysR family regulator